MTFQVCRMENTVPAPFTGTPTDVAFHCLAKGRDGDSYSWPNSKIRKEFWWAIGMSGRFISPWTWVCQHCKEEGDVCTTERYSWGGEGHQCAKSYDLPLHQLPCQMAPLQVLNIQGRGMRGNSRMFSLSSVSGYVHTKGHDDLSSDTHVGLWPLPHKRFFEAKIMLLDKRQLACIYSIPDTKAIH